MFTLACAHGWNAGSDPVYQVQSRAKVHAPRKHAGVLQALRYSAFHHSKPVYSWAKQMPTARVTAVHLPHLTSASRLPSRSSVLRQGLLLAVSTQMTAVAAHGQANSTAVVPSLSLHTGARIPAVGLGVFLAR